MTDKPVPSNKQRGPENTSRIDGKQQAEKIIARVKKGQGFSAAELQHATFRRKREFIESFVVEGVTLLAGKPKKGKSWMALGIALDVAEGAKALNTMKTRKSNVLYYALEDNERRMQSRMKSLRPDTNFPDNLHIKLQLDPLPDAIDIIRQDVEEQEAEFVIIDTVTAIRPLNTTKAEAYQQDYNSIKTLTDLANELRIAILIVYHTKKGIVEDAQDAIMGSTGITGAVDSWAILTNTKSGGTLEANGRDIRGFEWDVEQDDNGRWVKTGDAGDRRKSEKHNEILSLLIGKSRVAVEDIRSALTSPTTPSALNKMLHDMAKAGEIKRIEHGVYALAHKH